MREQAMRILFLCTGNSCRSQMAEGLARKMGQGEIEAFSAGTQPRAVHALAIEVMAELDIDISRQTSKSIDKFIEQHFDFVITVCDKARERCPVWPRSREQIHWAFDDPAEALGTAAQRLSVFRRVRNEIKRRLELFMISNLREPSGASSATHGRPLLS